VKGIGQEGRIQLKEWWEEICSVLANKRRPLIPVGHNGQETSSWLWQNVTKAERNSSPIAFGNFPLKLRYINTVTVYQKKALNKYRSQALHKYGRTSGSRPLLAVGFSKRKIPQIRTWTCHVDRHKTIQKQPKECKELWCLRVPLVNGEILKPCFKSDKNE
jgi:hypothetical protein